MVPSTVRATLTRLQRLGYTTTDDGGTHLRLTHPSGHVLHLHRDAEAAAQAELLVRAIVALGAGPTATARHRGRVRSAVRDTERSLAGLAALMRQVPTGPPTT